MRALRRIATPASVVAALTGCSFPLDDFKVPAKNDAALTTNGDAAHYEDVAEVADSAASFDTATPDADVGVVVDIGSDACVCVHELKGECKQWEPPNCGR